MPTTRSASLLGRAVTISGLGAYVPGKVVTNDDLSAMLDTSDAWIAQRTGKIGRASCRERV
jgi:3-oxoacyl-[acyl-carrier-protein] synthase-3